VLSSTAVGHRRSESGRNLRLLVVFDEVNKEDKEDALGAELELELELEEVESDWGWICRGSARPGRCKGGRLRGIGRSGGT
jgi:hypothetical protein